MKKRKLQSTEEEERSGSGCRGTGNVLQDLITSEVILSRVNIKVTLPTPAKSPQGHRGQSSCTVCGTVSQACQPLTRKESETLEEFILSPFFSIGSKRSKLAILRGLCPSCSMTLEKLSKLKKEIDKITSCLRAIVRIQFKKHGVSGGKVKDVVNVAEIAPEIKEEQSSYEDHDYSRRRNRNSSLRIVAESDQDNPDSDLDMKPEIMGMEIDALQQFCEDEGQNPLTSHDDLHSHTLKDSFSLDLELDQSPENCVLEEKTGKEEIVVEVRGRDRPQRASRLRAEKLVQSVTKSEQKEEEEGSGSDASISGDDDDTGMASEESCTDSEYDGDKGHGHGGRKKGRGGKSGQKSEVLNKNPGAGDCVECKECNLTFTSKFAYGTHIKRNTTHDLGVKCRRTDPDGNVTFVCGVCDRPYRSVLALYEHTRHNHKKGGKTTTYRCDPCNKDFHGGQALRHHMFTDKHIQTVEGEGALEELNNKKKFECETCKKRYLTLQMLQQHNYRMHIYEVKAKAKEVPVRCEPCNKVFKSDRLYKSHLKTDGHVLQTGDEAAVAELENQKKKFICSTCGRSYSTQKRLTSHEKLTHGQKCVCETCGSQLSNLHILKHHIKKFHSEIPRPAPKIPNRFIPYQDRKLSCPDCEKRFSDREGLRRHRDIVHKGVRRKCDLCPREFRSRFGVRYHKMKAHGVGFAEKKCESQYPCDICPGRLRTKRCMKVHMELKHFPNKSSCPYGCPDKIENDTEWIHHLEECKSEKMTPQSKCVCFHCQHVFRNQLLNIDHQLRSHTSYPCEFCERTFTARGVLEKHLSSHKESRPFLCPKCGKRFGSRNVLTVHSILVCGEDEEVKKALLEKRRESFLAYKEKEKPHKCDLCSKAFLEEKRLDDHKKRAHLNMDNAREDTDISDEDEDENTEEESDVEEEETDKESD